MENLIFTGSILGWSALNYMLKEEGVFENLCDLPVNSDIHIPMIPSILQNYSTIEYLPFETHNNLMPPSTQSSLITSSNVSSVFYTNQVCKLINFHLFSLNFPKIHSHSFPQNSMRHFNFTISGIHTNCYSNLILNCPQVEPN